ncbi:hypothetical protein AB0383_24195 [Amycolatopsis sp. NPDC051373]|uniref:hypothetical protein n=1 Tax=Amycolatopsis sp. NPDC051373 TaxID=3155801 RepID=UPI00344ECE44
MTLHTSVPTLRDGVPGGQGLPLNNDADVARLTELLAQPWADSGSIQTDDVVLDVAIRDG